ncbi:MULTISPECIES: SDR family oxidoreductase [Niastella]|uniref:SDR family oxidoreductase n=1 Tax=Niastella soli TaxID=2821487 RepID=A0ABS3Z1V0_9BACT|nr:SDR family oxidoreductase [Niastella soli]MBO9204134.1 SDR family oxidoreductase [Niastella soli]
MSRLQNKTALITGGNSGIGFATAKEFLQQGATVIITGRSQSALDKAKQDLQGKVHTILSDTSNLSDIRALAKQVQQITPRLDVVFINAGIGKFAPIGSVTEEHYDEQFNINVKGAYFTIQEVLPLINDGGSIILNTSINAHMGMANTSVYAATKAALLTLARTLSTELLPRKIRVNAISPGPVTTEILKKTGLTPEEVNGFKEVLTNQVPIGRLGDASEIARIATFFASDDSSFVIGAELIADGGMITL